MTLAAHLDCSHSWGRWHSAMPDTAGQTALDVTPGAEPYQYRVCRRCRLVQIREQLRLA